MGDEGGYVNTKALSDSVELKRLAFKYEHSFSPPF